MFLRSKIRFNIHKFFGRFCLFRDSSWNSVLVDGASEYSKVWLTQPISSHAKGASQPQQLSRLRKECAYFLTKTQQTEQTATVTTEPSELCFPLKIFDQKSKSAKAKKQEM